MHRSPPLDPPVTPALARASIGTPASGRYPCHWCNTIGNPMVFRTKEARENHLMNAHWTNVHHWRYGGYDDAAGSSAMHAAGSPVCPPSFW